MTKREVRSRLDEIVAFAGLEQFMDTPVKRYSSGMYLRLGFAIAAHMEAEILLVDEVLAVGDVEFQRRCLGKMDEVERSGRTVLFVSHNMDAMARLCTTTMWLDKGRVRGIGPTAGVIEEYMRSTAAESTAVAVEVDPNVAAQVVGVALVDEHGVPQSVLTTRATGWIRVDVVVNAPGARARPQLPGAHACGVGRPRRGGRAIGSTRRWRRRAATGSSASCRRSSPRGST